LQQSATIPHRGWILAALQNGNAILTAGGDWVIGSIVSLEKDFRALDFRGVEAAVFDLGEIDRLDTAGAWLLLRMEQILTSQGITSAREHLRPEFLPLLRQVGESSAALSLALPDTGSYVGFMGFLAHLGLKMEEIAKEGRDLLGFFGLVSMVSGRLLRRPSRLRRIALVAHMEATGVNAVPIVALLALLIGVVFGYQSADQLRRFGAEIYTVNVLGVAILRELGVLITAILVSGRSGSAFTAQIGAMMVNEEVAAIRALGLDPIEVLVLPRLYALVLTMPLLAFFADAMGLLGGALMAWGTLDISIPVFLRQLRTAITYWPWTFWVGIIKAPFFAAIIALVGCYEGFRVSGSAEDLGRLTTQAVVESIFLIIAADAVFSILFSRLGI
jgi:phospholipid/cholesterol/gamma-HCH transport system permease protein